MFSFTYDQTTLSLLSFFFFKRIIHVFKRISSFYILSFFQDDTLILTNTNKAKLPSNLTFMLENATIQMHAHSRVLRPHLVELLNSSFLVFKQHYIHFYTTFHPHVFQKTTNNIIQTPLPNGP